MSLAKWRHHDTSCWIRGDKEGVCVHRWEDEVEDEGIERIRSTSGKSGNETKECLFLVYSKCCITSSLASLHRNVLTSSENKNVMILSVFLLQFKWIHGTCKKIKT